MIEKLQDDFYSTRIRGGSCEGVVTCDGEAIVKKLNEIVEAVNRLEQRIETVRQDADPRRFMDIGR